MGDVVVITGLGQGMGKEVATKLAQAGHTIAGFDVDAQSVDEIHATLKKIGGDHLIETLDITDRSGILSFRDRVLERYQRVDTVISNVGIGFFGPFEEVDLEKAMKCMEINVIGAAAIFQAFVPAMRQAGRGKLIAMSSLVGRIPFPFESIYSASKFAVQGLVESLEYEVRPFGIQVALVEPAQVSTGFAAKIHRLPPQGSAYRERARRFIEKDNQLIESATTPEKAAAKIVRLVTAQRVGLHNQVDLMSTFFLFLNRVLPKSIRDWILLNHMDIRV